MTLLEKCNADVFAAILEFKSQYPENGEYLISILQKHKYWWQMTGEEIVRFEIDLPYQIWNGKIITFNLLFKSQQTTTMQ